jgi:hypothetical protein
MTNDTSTHSPTADHPGAADSGKPDLDEMFDILRHPYRRHALAYLIDEGVVPIDDLYAHIARVVPSTENGPDSCLSVKAAFHHCHRPKLEAAELIEYDEDEQVVRPMDAIINLEPHLELAL